jgi:hypothetical protein
MRLNPASGAMAGPVSMYGSAGASEGFNSVMETFHPTSPGYVIGGQVNGESWSIKVTPPGTGLVWDYIYKATGTTSFTITGLAERKNTSGAMEHFAVCKDASNKALVYKLDANGVPFGITFPGLRDQFQYTAATSSTPTWQTTGVKVAVNTSGLGNDGLSVFGFVTNPGISTAPHYTFLAKTYFNGVVGCSEVLLNASRVAGPALLPTPTPVIVPITVTPQTVTNQVMTVVTPNILCSSTGVAGGSNARKAKMETAQELSVFPNPVTDQLTVTGPVADGDGTVRVELVDLLGRNVYTQTLTGMNAQFSLSINRANLNCPAGMYLLNVYNGDQKETRRIVFAAQ